MYNFADIKDYKKFPSRALVKDNEPFHFSSVKQQLKIKDVKLNNDSISFETFLEQNKTVAFLVIKDDSIRYEKYFAKHDTSSIVPSFSMAKSVTSILIGCAIDEVN